MASGHKILCARAARFEFSDAYCQGISSFRDSRLGALMFRRHFSSLLPGSLRLYVLKFLHDPEVAQLAWDGAVSLDNSVTLEGSASFRVLGRKRPLQPQEVESGAYDCVSTERSNNAVLVHDGRVHRDGRTLYMSHCRFCLDHVFGEHESNSAVYDEVMRPLLRHAMCGGRSTLLLFGQTGTGKTYTAQGVLNCLVAELFSLSPHTTSRVTNRDSGERQDMPVVTIYSYELAGTLGGREGWFDLLAERAPVKCLTGEDGQIHVRGSKGIQCFVASELESALETAFRWRSSESTERNEASSRSHAIIELHLQPNGKHSLGTSTIESFSGVIRIVDLAGSERNYETLSHTRKMAERGGHINYSLLMLKECARLMHRHREQIVDDGVVATHQPFIPFRRSRLTHLLQGCFLDRRHKTAVLTTLSPAPTDVEHTLNSLQHVGMMRFSNAGLTHSGASKSIRHRFGVESGTIDSFSAVGGRGHGLHSKLQDARKSQLALRAFSMMTDVGGTILKRYEPEIVKQEAFIDPRYHRELNVAIEEDLWVMKEADAEAIQVLNGWREEQWETRRSHQVGKWDAITVRAFVQQLALPGEVRLPATLTGAQLLRLGLPKLTMLCSDAATAEALYTSLLAERDKERQAQALQASRNAKIAGLGAHKVALALGA